MTARHARKIALTLVKVGLSAALLTYLFREALADDSFERLRDQPKNWWLLSVALISVLAANVIGILRWMMLVRAIGLPFTLKHALRLGFLGYMLNFVSLGSVGGDLFKAVFIARHHPGRRTHAVATVIVDRMLGLYGLFAIASIAILFADLPAMSRLPQLRMIASATLLVTAIGALVGYLVMVPGLTGGFVSRTLTRLPLVGGTLEQLIAAVRMYRKTPCTLAKAMGLALVVHAMLCFAMYFIARGIPGKAPTLAEHFVIVPLGNVAGALPLPFAGLGALEYGLHFLYRNISAAGSDVVDGFLVALCYRIITLIVAGIGLAFYFSSRHEVQETLHEAEEELEHPDGEKLLAGSHNEPV